MSKVSFNTKKISILQSIVTGCFSIMTVFVNPGLSFAQQASIDQGVAWLLSAQRADGSWSDGNRKFLDTHTTVETLLHLGIQNDQTSLGLNWVNGLSPENTNDLSQQLEVLAVSGANVVNLVTSIKSAQQLDGGWGVDLDKTFPNEVVDTLVALGALSTAGAADTTTVSKALAYLLDAQNTDGGWGGARGQPSEVYYTALALLVLKEFQANFGLNTSTQAATNYLVSLQNTDGGFGDTTSTAFETALALQAMLRYPVNPANPSNAVNYLVSSQQANGSWFDDAYSTALAIRALADVRPNLLVLPTEVLFSPTTPQEGQSVNISTTVRNTGLEDAANVVVRFFSGDPASGGIQIGLDQTIASVPAGGSTQVSVTHTFTGTGGRTIFVQIDPNNQIAETSESDNAASTRLWVATAPDLAVFSTDLIPSTYTPSPGTAFALEYTVRNLGESAVGPFTVALYDGDPSASGTFLTSANLSGVAGAGNRTETLGVTLTSAVAHTLYLVADSNNQITEQSETNNRGSVTVQVGATPMAADLVVTNTDLSVTPARPQAGETVQVTARFRNEGTEPANGFTMEIFDGAPEAGGTLIHSEVRSLAPGEEQSITTSWVVSAGTHDLYVVLDRANNLAEVRENNNRAMIRVMTDMVDVVVSATDMVFTPSHPVMGDPVVLTITVGNMGIRNTGAFTVALYDGDPAAGGVLLQTNPVSNITGDGSAALTYNFTAEARTYRFYMVADTENQIAELYETNNQAVRSLTVKGPGETLGPDLVPIKIDVSNAIVDARTLGISGTASVTVQNKGDAKITTAFSVLIFDDTDQDGRYTVGVDTALGTAENTLAIWPEGATLLNVTLSGTVRFVKTPLYALVDANDAIAETEEGNNTLRSGLDCEVRPAQPIQPVLKWRRNDPVFASFGGSGVHKPPAIVNLTDDNGDGQIDIQDTPDVIYVVDNEDPTQDLFHGKLWGVRGDTGQTIFSAYDPLHPVNWQGSWAVGDLDGDGLPEIVVYKRGGATQGGGRLLVYEHDGALKWDNYQQVEVWQQAHPFSAITIVEGGIPLIADLNADGQAEIVNGTTVVNADGSIRCVGEPLRGSNGVPSGQGTQGGVGLYRHGAIVADLDLDGMQEIVAGNVAYRADCAVYWFNQNFSDGFNAVGNFDDDPYPEVVLVSITSTLRGEPVGSTTLSLLEHDGSIKWGPVYVSQLFGLSGAWQGGPPIIADFDGDGISEIGYRARDTYAVFDGDGQVKMTYAVPHPGSGEEHANAPTVFDLDGDGRPEVLINNASHFKIFDGESGALVYQEPYGTSVYAAYQNVIIADVDGDNHAEAIVTGYGRDGSKDGIRVYGGAGEGWVNARRIRNQNTYHITNVNDNSTIPQYESPSWLLHNSYRVQAPVGEITNPYSTPNVTASYLRAIQTGTGLDLTVRVGNGGAIAAPSGVAVNFYNGDPAAGGVLIGTALTTRSLVPGDYQDITFHWNGATGSPNIYAVVNPDGTLSECDTTDNRVSLAVTITPQLADLYITTDDIQLPTGPLYEGSQIPVSVTVHNGGTASIQSVPVRLTLGDPAQGGIEIGMGTISEINVGGTATLSFLWDSLGAVGINYLYAQADPNNVISESTKDNNLALKGVDLLIPDRPDLVIESSGISFSNASPPEGEVVTVTAQIRNRGTAVGNVPAQLYLGDPSAGGTALGSIQTIFPVIPHGGTAQVQWNFETVGRAGANELSVWIDPMNSVTELFEDNNQAHKALFVQGSGISASLSTDKSQYTANENVRINLLITNTSQSARTMDAQLQIEDSPGNLVQTITTLSGLNFSAGETKTFLDMIYNTGKTFAGDYRAHVRLLEGGTVVREALASFTILPVRQAASTIVSDKISYSSNESVALTSTVTSQSPNSVLASLEAIVTVTDPNGVSIFTETRTLADLLPEARVEFRSFTNTGTYPAGLYTATLQMRSNGTSLTSAQANFEILSSAEQAAALAGSIEVNPTSIFERESTALTYTIQNIGNDIDLPIIQAEILVVDSDTELAVRTIPAEASLNGREVFTSSILFDSTGLAPKPYLIVLRGTTAGVTQALDSTGLVINPVPNNAPLANAGPDQFGFVGQPVLLNGTASSDPDGDTLTFTWHFTSVPATSQLTDGSLANATTPNPSFIPDTEGIYVLSLVVNDGLVDSPVDTVSVFVNPPPTVDIHPETINLKSNGGSRSITGVLTSPLLSSFEFFTAEDGVTVTANFVLENQYIASNGEVVIFTILAEDYPGDDTVVPVDADGDGDIDLYQLTLKFNRDLLIVGFKDANGQLRITQPTELISTVIGNSLRIGSDTNTVISPP
jgi:subtilase family serine protease